MKNAAGCVHTALPTYKIFRVCTCCENSVELKEISRSQDWKLMITLRKGEVWIRGDQSGLEELAQKCLWIIGKDGPAGHDLLQWQMNTLLEGSVETILEYSDDPADYKNKSKQRY